MKKLIPVLMALVMLCTLFASCSTTVVDHNENAAEIVVFAAASMTETLNEIKEMYVADHPGTKLTFNFDSSGTLQTQIEEGAVCDLFISAAQKQMDALEKGAYLNTGTRMDLLENKVVLCAADNSSANIKTYEDMKNHLEAGDITMAIGNEDVPVGQYTQKIFAYYGLDEKVLNEKGVLSYGTNVKEVTTQISEGTVDCGIIYQTDAYSAGLTVSDTATEEMCGKVIYPAAVLKSSEHSEKAKEFLAYLQTEKAAKVFEKVGFTPIK